MIKTIQQLYPQATTLCPDEQSEHYTAFTFDQQTLYIPNKLLDERQQTLLQLLAQPSIRHFQHPHANRWFSGLYEKQAIDTSITQIRFVHLLLHPVDSDFDSNLWQETLAQAIEGVITIFPIAALRFVIVIQPNIDLNILATVCQTLDIDFSLTTYGCLGHRHQVDSQLERHYHAELALIEEHLFRCHPITPLTTLLLHTLSDTLTQESPFLQNLQKTIRNSMDYQRTVTALFEHQLNLTHAADSLFIHRNTLSYRMSKFAKDTGLNLQHLPDLVLCYMLLEK